MSIVGEQVRQANERLESDGFKPLISGEEKTETVYAEKGRPASDFDREEILCLFEDNLLHPGPDGNMDRINEFRAAIGRDPVTFAIWQEIGKLKQHAYHYQYLLETERFIRRRAEEQAQHYRAVADLYWLRRETPASE